MDAVVIGAGIAGLAAARVLADRFDRVVVVERDALPDGAQVRQGVPQGAHPHVLLVAGMQALDELFGGVHDELVRRGAVTFEAGTGLALYRSGRMWPAQPLGLQLTTFGRPLLEWVLRQRLAQHPAVVLRDRTAVAGLTGDTGRVTGVTLDSGEHVGAALVVDCTGRGARSDRWLAALAVPAPATVEVKIGVGYASRVHHRSPGDLDGAAHGLLVVPSPPGERRLATVLPVEGDRWLVGLGGWHGDSPAADPDEFARFAASLPYDGVARLLRRARPLSDVAVHRYPSSRRRLFERLPAYPAGFLTLGDAVASFNPIYGQGMTSAALQAQALGRALDAHGTDAARAFYRAAARIVATPWTFAVGADFNYPQTTGPRPRTTKLMNRYAARIQRAAYVSTPVRRSFFRVQHLLDPPASLFAPGVVARVLRHGGR